MKTCFFFLVLIANLFTQNFAISQTVNTRNSYVTPNNNTIRALVLFAEIDFSVGGCPSTCGAWTDNWTIEDGITQVPDWAGELFNSELAIGAKPSKYISKYYYEASFGEYTLLGDYYDKVIKVPCTGQYCNNTGINQVLSALATEPSQTTKNGYHMSDFDMWDMVGETANSLRGNSKTPGSDDFVDLLIIIWRNNQYVTEQASGVGGFGTQLYNNSISFGDVSGYNNATSYCVGTGSFIDACGITITEHVHGLFGGNNWHSAGGAGLRTFLTIPGSYGITGQYGASSKRVCGWDRNEMGWENPNKNLVDNNYISCGEGAGEILTDLTIENYPNGGEFILRDHAITGDAVRVKIPHLNWAALDDVKNQYIWLENRQFIVQYNETYGYDWIFRTN